MSRPLSQPVSGVEIVEVDPFDDAAVDRWHAAYVRADGEARAQPLPWGLEEVRADLQQDSRVQRTRAYLGWTGAEVVAAGWLRLPLADNRHRAELGVFVVPERRRRGHGTAVLQYLTELARAAGRTVLGAETSWPYPAGADGAGSPGREFGRRRGYELAMVEVMRTLRLPVSPDLLDRLAADAAPHHAGYTLHGWVGAVPEEFVAGWADITALLETEAPTGALELEVQERSVADVREGERLLERQRRTSFGTVACDPDGEVVAYTQIVYSGTDHRAYQWGTLVRGEHRGHRLGMAVKLANLRLLQRELPEVPLLATYNADVNRHMVSVNEALGFEPVEWLGELQRRHP